MEGGSEIAEEARCPRPIAEQTRPRKKMGPVSMLLVSAICEQIELESLVAAPIHRRRSNDGSTRAQQQPLWFIVVIVRVTMSPSCTISLAFAGTFRREGKTYIVQDGNIINFLFNV